MQDNQKKKNEVEIAFEQFKFHSEFISLHYSANGKKLTFELRMDSKFFSEVLARAERIIEKHKLPLSASISESDQFHSILEIRFINIPTAQLQNFPSEYQ